MAYTLIESCKAAGVEPFAYLTDVLTRLPGLPVERGPEFTPRAWCRFRKLCPHGFRKFWPVPWPS